MPAIAEFWDGAAATFDHEPDHGLRDAAVRAAWSARLTSWAPRSAVEVLDVGCGTGTLSLLLAERGHRLTLVDLSPRMLALARAKLAAAGVAGHLLLADAADPPLRHPSFDVVLARHLLWTLPDPLAALRRWVRLVRPGGRMILVEGRWTATGGSRPYASGADTMPWVDGVGAETLARALDPLVSHLHVEPLLERQLWGRDVDDERYAIIADVG